LDCFTTIGEKVASIFMKTAEKICLARKATASGVTWGDLGCFGVIGVFWGITFSII
jgi:hypothetical protein